jgi:hypothetical protein
MAEWCRISDNRCILKSEWTGNEPDEARTKVTDSKIEAFTPAKNMVEYERYFRVQCFAPPHG